MNVSQIARRAGVSVHAVRYYARRGLLQPNRDAGNGYRRFTEADLRCIQFIRRAQRFGLSLAEIGTILHTAQSPSRPSPAVREILQKGLTSFTARHSEIQAVRKTMSSAIRAWDDLPHGIPAGEDVRRLIDALTMP
jgi:DNA-binding transcriptional MerR regulator